MSIAGEKVIAELLVRLINVCCGTDRTPVSANVAEGFLDRIEHGLVRDPNHNKIEFARHKYLSGIISKEELNAELTSLEKEEDKLTEVQSERDRYRKALLDIKNRVLVIDTGQGTVSTMLQYIRDDINAALGGREE